MSTYNQHKAAFVKLVQKAAYRHDIYTVFSDFVEMAAISIANTLQMDEEREKRYMQIVKAYDPAIAALFPQMLGHITMALECEFGDPLGESYMMLEISNDRRGQFFTPYSLCQAIAAMNGNIGEHAVQRGFVTVSDPAIGGGALLIAFAEEAKKQGLNYQTQVHATGQDLDIKAIHMSYVQLSLLGVPAVVIHGDTLALEQRSRWCTPMHVLGLWDWKLKGDSTPVLAAAPRPAESVCAAQMELFV